MDSSDSSSALVELAAWYESQCDGDWEHSFGVKIDTLDNPGWSLTIDLESTPLERVQFPEFKDRHEHELMWLRCWREGNTFNAACGPSRLEDAVLVFLEWARSADADR